MAVLPWVRREWRRRLVPLVLLGLLVALTSATSLAALNGARRTATAFGRFSSAAQQPDLQVGYDLQQGYDPVRIAAGAAAFDDASRIDGVRSATDLAIFVAGVPGALEPWQFGVVRTTNGGYHGMVVRGRLPAADRADEVTLNEAAARVLGVDVGGSFTVETAAPAQAEEWLAAGGQLERYDGPELTLRVAGITRLPDEVAQVEDRGVGFGPAFYERHRDDVLTCRCAALFRVDPDRLDAVQARLQELYGPAGYQVSPFEGGGVSGQAARGIDVEVAALLILAAVAALAGLVVVAQGIGRELGAAGEGLRVLRVLGTDRSELTAGGVALVAPAVVAGVLAGTAVAVAASPLFPTGLARQAEAQPGPWVDLWALVGATATALLVLLATVWLLARRTASARAGTPRRLAPVPGRLPLPSWLGAAFAFRPGPRARVAVASAVAASALAAGGVLGVWSFEASRARLLAEPRLFGIDADLMAGGRPAPQIEALAQDAAAMPGVDAVALGYGGATVAARHGSRSAEVSPTAYRAERGVIGPTVLEGRRPEGPAEVVIGRRVAGALDVGVGDSIEVGEAREVLTVVGTVVSWGGDDVESGFVLTAGGFEAIPEVCPLDAGCAAYADTATLRLAGGRTGRQARADLVGRGWVRVPEPSTVDNLRQAGAVPLVLAGFLALLGGGGLAHAVVVSLRARRRDLSVVRSLGLGAKAARSSLRWAAVMLALAGAAVGVPVGVLLGRAVWDATADSLGVVHEQALPLVAVPLVVLVMTALALALAELPARRAGRVRPAEILRSE